MSAHLRTGKRVKVQPYSLGQEIGGIVLGRDAPKRHDLFSDLLAYIMITHRDMLDPLMLHTIRNVGFPACKWFRMSKIPHPTDLRESSALPQLTVNLHL